jgi:hypothetical protein
MPKVDEAAVERALAALERECKAGSISISREGYLIEHDAIRRVLEAAVQPHEEGEADLRENLQRLVDEGPAIPFNDSDYSQGYARGWDAAIERVVTRLRAGRGSK